MENPSPDQFVCVPFSVINLGGECVAVYVALGKFAGCEGECWPSMKRLEELLGWSDYRIRLALQKLIDAGIIQREPRVLDNGGAASNIYRLKTRVSPPSRSETPLSRHKIGGTPKILDFPVAEPIPSQDPLSSQDTPPLLPQEDPSLATGQELNTRELNTRKKNPPTPPRGDDGWNDFWDAFPRKAAKQDALRAWRKLSPSPETRQEIMAAIEQQKLTDQWRKDNGNFIPHPATWINQRRWEDDVKVPPKSTNPDDYPYNHPERAKLLYRRGMR